MIGSIDDFKSRLIEIDTLLAYARANQRSLEKYKLFNKTAIVLMCSHFEIFIESFISEHVDVLKSCYDSGNLPQYMKDNYIDDTIRSLKEFSSPSKKQRPLKALFKLHGDSSISMNMLGDLILDMRFSYGKHGQEETEKLFKKFGLASFVSSSCFKDNFRRINSAISIRNNIIHEGSAPTLSHTDIVAYKQCFLLFADGLETHVLNNQMTYYNKEYY